MSSDGSSLTFEWAVRDALFDLGFFCDMKCNLGENQLPGSGLEAVPVIFHHRDAVLQRHRRRSNTRENRMMNRKKNNQVDEEEEEEEDDIFLCSSQWDLLRLGLEAYLDTFLFYCLQDTLVNVLLTCRETQDPKMSTTSHRLHQSVETHYKVITATTEKIQIM